MADLSAEGAPIASADASVSTQEANPKSDNQPTAPDFSATRHKLKANDREKEVDYQTLRSLAEKGLGADELFRKAATKEKHWGKILEAARTGDFSALEALIGEEAAVKWAESRIRKEMEWDGLTKEQQEVIKERRRREAAEEKAKSYEDKEKEREDAVFQQQAAELVDKEMNDAFAQVGLKPTPELIGWVCDYKEASMIGDDGELVDGISYIEAVKKAQRRFKREAPSVYSSMSPEDQDSYVTSLLESLPVERLRAALPKHVLDALRKADLEDVRSQDPHRSRGGTTLDSTAQAMSGRRTEAKRVRMTTDEYFKSMEQKLAKKYGGR